jgi:hypothetical protein
MVVTFESAEALKQSKQEILDHFWNKDVFAPSNVIKSMDAMMKEIKSVETWRANPQLQGRMKCLAHTKKCWEEWQANKKARFEFLHCETLNTLVLTMTCTVPMRSKVYDIFQEEAKKPIEKPKAVEPFVGRSKSKLGSRL